MSQAASGKRRSFYADLDHLRSHFDSIDYTNTGYIGYDELKQLAQKMPGIEESDLPQLMAKLDRDEDGKVSFEDFKALFEVERESMRKKAKLTPSHSAIIKQDADSPTRRRLPNTPEGVVLRQKPGRSHRNSRDFGHLSPIRKGHSRPPSVEYGEQGPSRMQYLNDVGYDTTDVASPSLKRNSRVLSFLHDSEDVLEGIGDVVHSKDTDELPSPPMSPTHGQCHDELSHVESQLESVIDSSTIDEAAIAKLCLHTKADIQEQQELISLLHFLDKKKVGHVSVHEFARGLQSCKNAAQVATVSTPFKSPEPLPVYAIDRRRHTISTASIPKLSEPFTPVHPILKQSSTPLSSTPLHQPVYSNMFLSVLDPDKSGYVKVDSLVECIQELGVETENNSSLEEALTEAVIVDQSGRVSVNDFTTSLEGALLTEGKSNNFLRQIALKTFHSEIHNLRSQVHQVSMERDNLQHSLNRTMDDKQKLVVMGQEQVDLVSKESEKILKDKEQEHLQRLKESEKSLRQDQLHMEDRYASEFKNLQEKLDIVKSEEEKLRANLKLAEDENNQIILELGKAHNDLNKKERMISMLQRDLESRSDYDLIDDGQQHSRLLEMENELMEKGTFISDLQEKLREIHDRYDLLTADNEKMKQKYLSAKRDIQRKRSKHSRRNSAERPLGFNKPQKPKRPLSGRPLGRSSPIKPRIFRSPLDLAIGSEKDHPVLLEDMDESPSSDSEPLSPPKVGEVMEEEIVHAVQDEDTEEEELAVSSTPTTETGSPGEEDSFSRSSASLMEEIQKHEQKSLLEARVKQLEDERCALQKQYQQLEQQLREAEEEDRKELERELERNKQKQEELDRLISALGKQSKRLSTTRMEIDSKLQVAEQSLANQLKGLRSSLTDNSGTNETGNLTDLIQELDTIRAKLEEERKSHDLDNANLNSQLAKLEEESYSQIDQSLKLEEEKAEAVATITKLQQELESERSAHEAEVNILTRKLDNAEQTLSQMNQKLDNTEKALLQTERKEQEKVIQLREELEHARDEIERYKLQTEKLKKKLVFADEKLAALPTSPPLSPTESSPPAEEVALFQDQIEALLKQLSKFEAENKKLRITNEEDISELKAEHEKHNKENEEKLTAQFSQEITSLKKDYERKLKQVTEELETSHSQERALSNSLSHAQTQLEIAQTEVHKLKAREESRIQHIQSLEEAGSSQRLEIAQLQADVKHYQDEIEQLHREQTTQQSRTSELSAQNRESLKGGIDETDFDEPDANYAHILRFPISKRLSRSSGNESRIIDDMKYQLGQLQQIIAQRRGSKEGEEDPEHTLMQQLMSSHRALAEEMEQAKQSFDEKTKRLSDEIADKERILMQWKETASEESMALRTATLATTNKIFRFVSDFNSSSSKSLSNYEERVKAVSSKLVLIQKLLHDRNSEHESTLDEMMSQIDRSREDSKQIQQELKRMKQEVKAKHEQDIRNIQKELDQRTRLEERARARSEETETQLVTLQQLLEEREQEVKSQAKRIQELESRSPVNEHVEAVQYVQMQPLEGINEALLLNTNQDSREVLTIKEQVITRAEPNSEQLNSEQLNREQMLSQSLQDAQQKLDACEQIQKTLEMQHKQALQDIETKTMEYEAELQVTNEVLDEHTTDLRELYVTVVDKEADKERATRLTHSQLVGELDKEVEKLKDELASEQAIANEMESTLCQKMAEHEQVEAQIQTEHDEEVQALHQQKQQLMRQLEDAKQRYSQSIKEQDQHTTVLIQDLTTSKSELEKQLRLKSEESLLVYKKVSELTDEKKVLVDIIEHLCVEAGKLIDVV